MPRTATSAPTLPQQGEDGSATGRYGPHRSFFRPIQARIGAAMKPRVDQFEKRKKEFARKERQKKKAERREERERERAERPAIESGEDPDIAGIVPGPQPPLEIE